MLSTRIALDVMGGDLAPEAPIKGALRASSALGRLRIAPERVVMVGDEERIRAVLEAEGGNPGFAVQHASEVIGMGESPAGALRAKRDSSIAVCIGIAKAGDAGGVVSMGNTGACVGAATLGLGTLDGVRRAGIAVTLDLTGNPVSILDMGANISPKPDHMLQYGVMGSIYMERCLALRNPRVGLLNIGAEPGKGTALLKNAHRLFEASGLNFVGNLEGGDVFRSVADVVVTDGFTGNVMLKLIEDFSAYMLEMVLGELKAHQVTWAPEALANVRRNIDYAEYGGALLLGVNGVVVIGHGRSDESAVANAIGLACRAIDSNVNQHIVLGVAETAAQTSVDAAS
ncbi:MAG: phosphate acyltransferase PlsX [Planctomycetota bacterium]|nr:phosphate acyltransferase PlsX [Planctomycetota bacterium]